MALIDSQHCCPVYISGTSKALFIVFGTCYIYDYRCTSDTKETAFNY